MELERMGESLSATDTRLGRGVVGLLVMGLIYQGVILAQGLSMDSLGQTGPPSGSGNPTIPIECSASAWSPYWDDQIYLYVDLSADNVTVGSDNFQGTGEVEGLVHKEIEMDRADRSLFCAASYWSGWGGSGSNSASGTLPGRVPTSLSTYSDNFQYDSPGNYLRTRLYQAKDQYAFPWNYVGDPIEEYYEISSSENGCNLISVATGEAQFDNSQGLFEDKLGNLSYPSGIAIPACQQVPSCTTSSRQYISVAGVWFDHAVDWSCTNVNVAR